MTRRLLVPVPRGLVVLLAAGVAVLTFARTVGHLTWPYADWVAVSADSRQALMLAGPWAAVWAAWCSSRFSGARSIMCPASSVRSGPPVVHRQLRVLVAGALSGWALGMLPSLAITARDAQAGTPDLLVILGAAVALAAYACLGYAVGIVVPSTGASAVALILSLLPGLAADSLGAVVAPVWTFDVVAGQDENPVVAVVRVLFFLSVALSLALASGLWLRGRGFSPGASFVQGVALLAVPVVLAVLSSSAPPPVLREDHPPRTCARTDGVEVCVHAARAPVLGPLTQAVADLMTVMGNARPPRQVVDAALWDESGSGTVTVSLQLQDGAGWRRAAIQDMAWQLSGAAACPFTSASGVLTDPAQLDASAVSGGVAVWMARQAGVGSPVSNAPDAMAVADRLDRASPPAVQAFLARHSEALQDCRASSSMLP